MSKTTLNCFVLINDMQFAARLHFIFVGVCVKKELESYSDYTTNTFSIRAWLRCRSGKTHFTKVRRANYIARTRNDRTMWCENQV